VLDGFVDGFNQLVRPREVPLQNLPRSLEGIEFFKISSAHDLFDLIQVEHPALDKTEFAVGSHELVWMDGSVRAYLQHL
jgi:hypothetical protein